jgi:carboxymethylenebutenolidase
MCTAPDEDIGPAAPHAVKEEERRISAGDGANMRMFVAEPATGFRRGAVLIIHDIWGYTNFYKELARRITQQGHAAAMVDFYARQGELPEGMRSPERTGTKPEAMARARQRAEQLSDERFLADCQTAVDALQARGAQRVAAWGFCSGGRLALIAAARVRGLAGVIAYYGFLHADDTRLSPMTLAGDIKLPILAVFGGADRGIPADEIARFEQALDTDKEFVTYPGAPHGFLRYGASDHKAAIGDALARTYRFLGRVLSS